MSYDFVWTQSAAETFSLKFCFSHTCRAKAVFAYFTSKQILPFAFAEQHIMLTDIIDFCTNNNFITEF